MFCLNGAQTQLSQCLSQALNTLNVARSGGLTRSYSGNKGNAATRTVAASSEEVAATQDAIKTIEATMNQLGLQDLPENIEISKLNPYLSCGQCEKERSPIPEHWTSQNSSANTFFENKNGFTEDHLRIRPEWLSSYDHPPSLSAFPKPLLQMANSLAQQQIRGFKTRPRSSLGVGTKLKEDEHSTALKGLRLSVMEKISGRNNTKQTDKLKAMVSKYDHSPELQDKIKVAFAEGYAANDKKDSESTNTWSKRVARWITVGLIIWILVQLSPLYGAMGGNMKINVLKGDKYEVSPQDINVSFQDVKGVDEAKSELQDVVEFLRDKDKFKALGAKLPKGVLLVGAPGIGKTLLARAVAGEAGVPFFHASGSEFDEIFVGTGAKRIRQLFEAAKAKAPCVIFIDEIDTVGAKRTSSQIHPYANQTINQLLNEMDGFQQNEGVIVLGATNRRDNLDRALLRPGRFDVEVRVYPPDLKGRRDILGHYLDRVKTGSDIDTDALARGTTGCTGADLENMVNQAALKAAMDGATEVTMEHMEFAKDKVLMGPARKQKIPDNDTNLMTAYHEAGHTLVAHFTKDAIPLHKVTIIPRGMSLGHTSFVPEKEQYNLSKSQLMAQMDVAMGGRVGEEVIYGNDQVTTGASSDFSQATGIATSMVKRYGMSEKVGVRVFDEEAHDSGLSMLKVNELSPGTTELVDNEIKRLLQESYDRARSILKTHASEHKALAKALMEYETLDAEEIKAVINGKKIKKQI